MMKSNNGLKPRNQMGERVYRTIAEIITKLPDEYLRREVGDHFATELRKRFASFDGGQFERHCGGRIRGYDIHRGRFHDGTVPPQ